MILDDKKFKLLAKNYVQEKTLKTKIILGNTNNHDMNHFTGWLLRYNGNYKKTAAFTIDAAGFIYNHFDPNYYGEYFKNKKLNKESIIILLDNDGWLINDKEKKEFITCIGDIYKDKTMIVEKKWRGYNYWSSYTEKQLNSAIELVKLLCNDFNIPLSVVAHNTKIDNELNYKNIMYKSNLNKYYTDVNPSWDFEEFKNKIETI